METITDTGSATSDLQVGRAPLHEVIILYSTTGHDATLRSHVQDPEVLHGDCLVELRELGEQGNVADLVYLDPPFLTNEVHKTKDGRVAFSDRWPSRDEWMRALAPRLKSAFDLLAPHGTIVIHLDPRTSHYVKVGCDEIFGDDNFAGEIIWRYRRWPSPARWFQKMHDVLLCYRKDCSVKSRWHSLYEPLASSTREVWKGKKQTAVSVVTCTRCGISRDITRARGSGHLEPFRIDPPCAGGRPHRWGKSLRVRSSIDSEVSRGAPMSDVWEISIIAPSSKERTGYPTQKPKALLKRLISALTDPGDLVVDPYAGSGTTLHAARDLGRRSIGIDSSEVAVEMMKRRLGL